MTFHFKWEFTVSIMFIFLQIFQFEVCQSIILKALFLSNLFPCFSSRPGIAPNQYSSPCFVICCNRQGFDFQFRFQFGKKSIHYLPLCFFSLYFIRLDFSPFVLIFFLSYITQPYYLIRCFCLARNILLVSVRTKSSNLYC